MSYERKMVTAPVKYWKRIADFLFALREEQMKGEKDYGEAPIVWSPGRGSFSFNEFLENLDYEKFLDRNSEDRNIELLIMLLRRYDGVSISMDKDVKRLLVSQNNEILVTKEDRPF